MTDKPQRQQSKKQWNRELRSRAQKNFMEIFRPVQFMPATVKERDGLANLLISWAASFAQSERQSGYAAALERAAQDLDRIRKLLCEGCKRDKPIVRPSHPSSIVGGSGIHTPEGWVCIADIAIEKLRVLAGEQAAAEDGLKNPLTTERK
jgi:hypothetical protein